VKLTNLRFSSLGTAARALVAPYNNKQQIALISLEAELCSTRIEYRVPLHRPLRRGPESVRHRHRSFELALVATVVRERLLVLLTMALASLSGLLCAVAFMTTKQQTSRS